MEDELQEIRLKMKQALLNAHINLETNRRSSRESSRLSMSVCSSATELSSLSLQDTDAAAQGDSRRLSFER